LIFSSISGIMNIFKILIISIAFASAFSVLVVVFILGLYNILTLDKIKQNIDVTRGFMRMFLVNVLITFFIYLVANNQIVDIVGSVSKNILLLLMFLIIQIILVMFYAYVSLKGKVDFGIVKMETKNILNGITKWIFYILLFLLGVKLLYMIVLNLIVDSYIDNIDITNLLQTITVEKINFSMPISNLLPLFLTDILNTIGVNVQMPISSLGITPENIKLVLTAFVYNPINEYIHNYLNVLTNGFIFTDVWVTFIGFIAILFKVITDTVDNAYNHITELIQIIIRIITIIVVFIIFGSSILFVAFNILLIVDLFLRMFGLYIEISKGK